MSYHLVSFGGWDLAAAGYSAKMSGDGWRGQLSNAVPTYNRPGALPVLGTASVNPRRMTFSVVMPDGVDFAQAYETLMARLRPLSGRPRLLVTERPNDAGAPTLMQRTAVVEAPQGDPGDGSLNIVTVTFISAEPYWRAVAAPVPVTIGLHDSTAWSAGVAYGAAGSAPIAPLVTIDPAGPSSGTAPNRYSFTVTNNRPAALTNISWLVDLGSTAGWTGSNGGNTYLFCDGQELPREAIAIGENKSYLLFNLEIAQGETKAFEILTGGSSPALATAPLALVGSDQGPVSDFGWQVVAATSVGSSTITVAGAGWETNRWREGLIIGLTGTPAGGASHCIGNTATVLTPNAAFPSFAAGTKFLLLASWRNPYDMNRYTLNYGVRLTNRPDDPAHGLWWQNHSDDAPQEVSYDHPWSWKPARTFDGPDDVAFKSTSPAVGDYFATPNISRTWQGGDDESNLRERGTADAVVFSSPLPVLNWKFDRQFRNPNGVAKCVIGSRVNDAEAWNLAVEDTDHYLTLTDIAESDIAFNAGPQHLLFGLWPSRGDEIPTSWARDSGGRTGGGYTSMQDDSKEWPPDIWKNARWRVTSGKGQGNSRKLNGNSLNSLTWDTPLPGPGSSKVPDDGSRYEVVNPPLIANIRSKSVWTVVLDATGIVTSGLTGHGPAERVAVRVRAGALSGEHGWLEIGVNRLLWISAGQTVVADGDARTAAVMSGTTVLRDVTDWVRAYRQEADGSSGKTAAWMAVDPGADGLYTQRVDGSARHAVSVVLRPGWLG